MALPSATLIVLAWNRWGLTEKCLATLRETDLAGAEVLVVDNGSTDETPAELREAGLDPGADPAWQPRLRPRQQRRDRSRSTHPTTSCS